jgi:hypothetical protein
MVFIQQAAATKFWQNKQNNLAIVKQRLYNITVAVSGIW